MTLEDTTASQAQSHPGIEYRAVYRHPPVYGRGDIDPATGLRGIGLPPDTYSRPTTDGQAYELSHAPGADETHAYVVAVQFRSVGPWIELQDN